MEVSGGVCASMFDNRLSSWIEENWIMRVHLLYRDIGETKWHVSLHTKSRKAWDGVYFKLVMEGYIVAFR